MREPRPRRRLLTIEEYLEMEERSEIRHEYVAGEVYAMSGATTRHNLIILNLARHLYGPARARGCRLFTQSVKVHVDDRIYYPDVLVACGPAADVELIVEAPSLVVEVTSPATRATDRREKLEAYRRLPSLQHYLIVDQRRKHVLAYRRDTSGGWERVEFGGGDEIEVPSLDLRLAVEEIYDDVPMPPLTVSEDDVSEDEWYEDELEEVRE